MAAQLSCHLKKCIQGPLEARQARVEVKAFAVTQEERDTMTVTWRDDGEAMFHDICWKAIIDSYKNDNPFTLEPLEKEMIKEGWKTAEYFDSMERVRTEAVRIARFLRNAKYAMAFTGAGISTAAGIDDYRGKTGKWTERDRAEKHSSLNIKEKEETIINYEGLRPTYTHEVLCKLMERGHIKYLISQNTDGLHRLSGIPRDKIAELHGNSFHEKCEKCNARYERPFACRPASSPVVPPKMCRHCHVNHRTGRMCERKGCDGYLMNTIINFGDGLEHHVLQTAAEHAHKNDLVLCLGTSLRVTPACDLVEMGQRPGKLVICNRQPTPFDKLCYRVEEPEEGPCGSRVFIDCDILMKLIIQEILDEEELKDWEAGRDQRMAEHDTQRRPEEVAENSPQ